MSTPHPPPCALTGRRVLVVEDDYFIADEMRLALEAGGAEVVGPVASVDGALTLLATDPALDAAVLDVNLRDVMVFPVADALAERGVPFVFATGYDGAALPGRYAHIPVCEKPVQLEALAQAMCAGADDR